MRPTDIPSVRSRSRRDPRRPAATRWKPPSARLRQGVRRELRHRRRARRGEGANVDHRTSPELRSPATVGRPPVVAGAVVQPLRRPGRRPRPRRPSRPHVVAGHARHGVRRPLRALAGPARSGLARQPRRVRRRVRARPRRRHAGNRRRRDRVPRRQPAAAAETDPAAAVPRGHRDVGRLRAGGDRRGQRDRAHPRSGSNTCWCCRCSSTRAARGAGAGSSSSTPPATRTSPTRAAATEASSSTSRRSPP